MAIGYLSLGKSQQPATETSAGEKPPRMMGSGSSPKDTSESSVTIDV